MSFAKLVFFYPCRQPNVTASGRFSESRSFSLRLSALLGTRTQGDGARRAPDAAGSHQALCQVRKNDAVDAEAKLNLLAPARRIQFGRSLSLMFEPPHGGIKLRSGRSRSPDRGRWTTITGVSQSKSAVLPLGYAPILPFASCRRPRLDHNAGRNASQQLVRKQSTWVAGIRVSATGHQMARRPSAFRPARNQ